MKKKIIILGNGIAGFSAASEIRRHSSEAEIVMVSQEKELPYLRPLLSKTHFEAFRKDSLMMEPESWYKKQQIRQIQGTKATKILTKEKKVLLENRETLDYDSCIYALGAAPFIPSFDGTDKKGVAALRTIEDLSRIRRLAATASHIVIIGGGVLGLEMAWIFSQMGCHVTILEAGSRLLEPVLDRQSAEILMEQTQKKGIFVFLGIQIKELTGQLKNQNQAGGVRLSDGRHFPADMVLISCGTTPNLGLALCSGLACRQGVLVTDYMETSVSGIYAAGDCIQWKSPNPGLWNYARISGETAGYNSLMPPVPRPFSPLSQPVILNTMGLSLYSIGNVSEDGTEQSIVQQGKASDRNRKFYVNHYEGENHVYCKRFYRNHRLCGAVLLGDLSESHKIQEELKQGGNL